MVAEDEDEEDIKDRWERLQHTRALSEACARAETGGENGGRVCDENYVRRSSGFVNSGPPDVG